MTVAGGPAQIELRKITNPSARSLLLTIVGELMWPRADAAWTSSLVHTLNGLGVEERAARQAINRAASAGWIESKRQGREVSWTVGPAGQQIIRDGAKRVTSMSRAPKAWDGQWLSLLVTIPKEKRNTRKALYNGLSWAGMGNPVPGIWMSPYIHREPEIDRLITEVGLQDHAISFIGHPGSIGVADEEIVERAWNIRDVGSVFQTLLEDNKGLNPASGDEMLFAHISVVSQWQQLPFIDPGLPEELLPNWIGRTTAAHLQELRESWAPQVHEYWRKLNASANEN